LAPTRDKKDAEQLHSRRSSPCQQTKSNDSLDGVIGNDRTPHVKFVAKPPLKDHEQSGKDIWWGAEDLRDSNAESEVAPENDWKEVGDGICHDCREAVQIVSILTSTVMYDPLNLQEQKPKNPNFEVECRPEELSPCESLRSISIPTISVESSDDVRRFLRIQEQLGLVSLLRKIDKRDPRKHRYRYCEQSLHNKDPSPCTQASESIHVREAVSENPRQGRTP